MSPLSVVGTGGKGQGTNDKGQTVSKKPTRRGNKKTSPPSRSSSSSPMDLDLLEQMIKLMSANDLNTVDVRDGDKRVILRRGAMQMSMPMAMPSYAPVPAASTPS